jgi:DNA-binding CsgD family transcriptional regulator
MMQQLSQSDCAQLLALTGEMYCVEDRECLPERLLKGLRRLIPFEFGGCHITTPALQQIAPCYDPERPAMPATHREFWRLTQTHPLHPVLFSQPARAWKVTDVTSRQAFRRTEFYNVLYRPLRVDCELTAALPDQQAPGRFLLLSLHRRRADFTERDRALLNLLLPHVAGARRRLEREEGGRRNQARCFGQAQEFNQWLRQHTPWGLTRREGEVLFWLCQGKTNAEIGQILGIAGRTAETHALRIYPKMGVENRYNAIATLNHVVAGNGEGA